MRQVNEFLYELAPSVYASVFAGYEDLGNGGIIITDEGVVLIDTDVRTVDRISQTLRELTDQPVRYVLNTHHAFDHSSANCIFTAYGVTVIGSESCREAMLSHGALNFERWSNRLPEVKQLLAEKAIQVAPPQITFTRQMQLHLGGKTIEMAHYGHAHSPGDIIVYLPREQVLFAGDLLWVGFFPNVREADVPNQLRVVDRILEMQVKYYVPGHGGVTTRREDIVVMRQFLAALHERVTGMVKEGKTLEEVRAIAESLIAKHSGWQGRNFVNTAIDAIYNSLTVQAT